MTPVYFCPACGGGSSPHCFGAPSSKCDMRRCRNEECGAIWTVNGKRVSKCS